MNLKIMFFNTFFRSYIFFFKNLNLFIFAIYNDETLETLRLLKRTYWDEIFKQYTKNGILKTKNSFSELEKDLKELKDRELKARGIKNEKEIEEQFFKPINVSIDNMEKFEKKMMK